MAAKKSKAAARPQTADFITGDIFGRDTECLQLLGIPSVAIPEMIEVAGFKGLDLITLAKAWREAHPQADEIVTRYAAQRESLLSGRPVEQLADDELSALESLYEQELATLNAPQKSNLTLPKRDNGRGQGDNEKGQRPKRPLNDSARKCLNDFNRKRDFGQTLAMKTHCQQFATDTGDSAESLYRTLKDYSDLWHKPAKRPQKGTK